MSRLRRIIQIGALLLLSALPAMGAPQKGQPAPAIKVMTTSGQQVTLANYKGYVLIMDFFATWCPPCREAVPHLQGLNRKYGKQGLQILGLSLDDDSKTLKEFAEDKKLSYPVALASEELKADYGLRSLPTIYIVSKKGLVADKFLGYNDDSKMKMEALIKKLLAE